MLHGTTVCLKKKKTKNIYHDIINQNKIGVVTLILQKVNFKTLGVF